jgi:hypothetical protein
MMPKGMSIKVIDAGSWAQLPFWVKFRIVIQVWIAIQVSDLNRFSWFYEMPFAIVDSQK